jgi:energy-converting hydrogenase Eha subunit C
MNYWVTALAMAFAVGVAVTGSMVEKVQTVILHKERMIYSIPQMQRGAEGKQ